MLRHVIDVVQRKYCKHKVALPITNRKVVQSKDAKVSHWTMINTEEGKGFIKVPHYFFLLKLPFYL
jgi:hypothetical protein